MNRSGKNRERQTGKQTLNYREQTEGCWRGGGQGMGQKLMSIKEGTCYDEYWVLYVSDESLYFPPETNTTLYVN